MADSRFYPAFKPMTVAEIVKLVRGELLHGHEHDEVIEISTPSSSQKGHICFVSNEKAAGSIKDSAGIVCLVKPDIASALPGKVTAIATPDPKTALGLVMRIMLPAEKESPGIDPAASIAETATIGKNCSIAPNVVVSEGAKLNQGCVIGPGVFIGRGCVLAKGVRVDANASITYAEIGEETQIGSSTVIGQIGFGVGRDQGNVIVPHLGLVRIGKKSNIGAATTIDRGFLDDTVIGDGVMIDNLCHIAHNVVVNDGNVICAHTGIAGSVYIGKNNVFGAQCGIADNVTIGDGNMFAARSGVTKDVGSGHVMGGFPAVPIQDFRRQAAAIRQLGRKNKRGD
jgi:UDP-3-O-[3-hydroxymyristoyl] glucosamine N-acyltransferase